MTILNIELPDSNEDFSLAWEPGFRISTKVYTSSPKEGDAIIISANNAGLVSLARYLLLLAQPANSVGQHYHFDDYNSLEKGSVELIIEKIE